MTNRYRVKGITRKNASARTLSRTDKHLRMLKVYDKLKLSRGKTNKIKYNVRNFPKKRGLNYEK